jgi:DNA-binding NarL/FixJ family response regulator
MTAAAASSCEVIMEEPRRVRVLLADRYLLVLEGLRRILEGDSDIEVVGIARTGDEAIRKACLLSPDVIVMDLEMPDVDGIDTTREIKRRLPDTRILVMSFGEDLVNEALEAGASGFLTKDSEIQEITTAVLQVSRGLCPIAPSITRQLMAELSDLRRNRQSVLLSDRETEVLRMISEGKKSNEIGAELFLSLSTVKREVGQIFDKLGVNDRPHAVSEAIKRRLI